MRARAGTPLSVECDWIKNRARLWLIFGFIVKRFIRAGWYHNGARCQKKKKKKKKKKEKRNGKRKELIRYDEFPISDELECVRTDDRYFHFNLPVNRVVSSSQRSDRSERWGREGGGIDKRMKRKKPEHGPITQEEK